MRIKRICKICGNQFAAIKVTQFFCRRKCFKRDYYLRTKAQIQEQEQAPTYPTRTCNFCLVPSELSFDPIRSPEKFNAWGCPHCGATNRLIWEHQHRSNSYQVIAEILVSIQSTMGTIAEIEEKFITYRLPATRPEQSNPSILVMTCETMNIADIQKKNRKKLLFS